MPSEDFYIWVGGIGGAIAILGLLMSSADPSGTAVEIRSVGSLIFLGGIILIVIVLGGAAIDITRRVREWRLDQREDDLYYKERRIEIKRQEAELKRKERQEKEETKQRAKQEEQRQQDLQRQEEYNQSEKQEAKKQEQAKFNDKVLFKTGSKVPDELNDKTIEESNNIISEPILEKNNEEFEYKISNDRHMQALWALYKSPKQEFTSRRQMIKAARGDANNPTPWYEEIFELYSCHLIDAINIKEHAGRSNEWGPKLTKLGLTLIQKAREDGITRWEEFSEKFAEHIRERREIPEKLKS